MSLVTRCTSCGTVFRVVQDQLKVSAGWVRCGKCGEVFNALQTLFDLERDQRDSRTDSPASSPLPAASSTKEAVDSLGDEGAQSHDADDATGFPHGAGYQPGLGQPGRAVDVDTGDPSVAYPSGYPETAGPDRQARPIASGRLDQPAPAPSFAASAPSAVDFPISILPEDQAVEERAAGGSIWPNEGGHSRWIEPDSEGDEADTRDSRLGQSASRQLVPTGRRTRSDADTPGFLRDADRRESWSSPVARGLLSFAALALAVLLLGQMAVHERDRVADAWPSSRPLLAQWCRVSGCELLEAPRRLETFTVESTALTKAPGLADGYRLTVTVRNRAAGPATLPSVELALTDADGQLVARRVLNPADFRVQRPVVPPGGETTLQLVFTSAKGRVNGYTVDLFYP